MPRTKLRTERNAARKAAHRAECRAQSRASSGMPREPRIERNAARELRSEYEKDTGEYNPVPF